VAPIGQPVYINSKKWKSPFYKAGAYEQESSHP
jgi:hypothetical protein